MDYSIGIGIIYKLMSGKRITAKELSNEFEMSTRTIYRYIDILSCSGVPLISFYGKYGGIEIDKNCNINENFITKPESELLLDLLKKSNKNAKNNVLIEKISAIYKN